jgi:uncharacterized membrane protein
MKGWSKQGRRLVAKRNDQSMTEQSAGMNQISSQEDPIQILKVRLAKDEITREQFEELRRVFEYERNTC